MDGSARQLEEPCVDADGFSLRMQTPKNLDRGFVLCDSIGRDDQATVREVVIHIARSQWEPVERSRPGLGQVNHFE